MLLQTLMSVLGINQIPAKFRWTIRFYVYFARLISLVSVILQIFLFYSSLMFSHSFFFLTVISVMSHFCSSQGLPFAQEISFCRHYSTQLYAVPVRCLLSMMEPRIWWLLSIIDSVHSPFILESIIGWI